MARPARLSFLVFGPFVHSFHFLDLSNWLSIVGDQDRSQSPMNHFHMV